nr:putative ribonuclease H-like domain-containing protein [Tanacetum cinerariifolium]
MSLFASPISADRHLISAGKSHVSAGRPTGSAGRPVSAGRPSGFADRTPVPAGRILGKFAASASSERFPRAFNVENSDIHDARIEAIRLFLAFASFMGFMVYQIDVKSAFLYGKIDEEAPRAWYERLSTFLLKHGYRRGTIDKTLFIKKDSKDIMLVLVYVDDIIFGSIRKDWCEEFETLMQSEFEMSSIGPITFFLGLQVDQRPDGIFIHQEKYVADILKKFDLDNSKLASTPFEPQKIREKNVPDEPISVHLYRFMIGCLMYLTATRPDIMFACKKQTIVATSSYEAEYMAAASCCGQSTWSMRLFERGFYCLRPILLVRMVSAGGHSFPLVAVVSITSAGCVTFCWLFPIPAGYLVSAGHMLFLLVMYFSCWYMTVTASDLT